MKKIERINTYWSSVPNLNNPNYREGDTPQIVPYTDSLLAKEPPASIISWAWKGWNVDHDIYALFDFCGEAFVDHIDLTLRVPKNEDHRDYQRFLFSYNTAADPRYRVCCRHLRQDQPEDVGDLFTLTFPIGKQMRCLNIQMERGEWYIPSVFQVEIYGEDPTAPLPALTAQQLDQEWRNEPIICDEFGQCTYIDWPGKITCEEDLRRDAERDAEALKNVSWNNERYDRFGGWKTGTNYGATGFFRTQKIDGVWWFITPEGNRYFMKGVDGIDFEELAHYSPLYQKGTDTVRGCYEKLPNKEEFPMAYTTNGAADVPVVAFQHANIYRKFGRSPDYKQKWADNTMKRLIDWNFNASGKWKLAEELKPMLPRVAYFGASDLICTKSGYDPWDPDFEKKLDKSFSEQLPPYKDDPMIIGYHFSNEDGWEMDDLRIILHTTDGSFPAKAAFVNFIKERYQNDLRVVNIVLDTEAASFEELVSTDINMDVIPHKDAVDFVQESSRKFHKTMLSVFRKYDPNHLFFGMTPVLGWRSCYEWDSAYADYVDVIAFDWYFSQTADYLRPYLFLDKPIINIELGWMTPDRGHGTLFGGMNCKDQAERIQRYTRYMRNQAKCPQFVGFGYFIYTDEVITGRNNGDGNWGECHQFGIVNEQDQPYEDYVAAIKQVNADLEELHQNGAPQE